MPSSRRTLLYHLAAAGGLSLAGCSERGSEEPTTVTDQPSASTTPVPTTPTQLTERSTTRQTETLTQTAESQRSRIAMADGFASPAPWLDGGGVSVNRVTEPTRDAFATAVSGSGPRLVVFETSGTIDLGGENVYLTISNDKVWIAGQTAPAPGITFIRGGVSLNASDCVIQHLRFRAGDAGHEPNSGWEPDSLRTGDDTTNNVIDHCTATWGIDETLSVGFNVADTTVTNSLVAEALHDSTHSEGRHGFGSIGAGGDSTRVSWLGILWALNSGRNPRLGGTGHVIANTVAYKFKRAAGLDRETSASFVGNGYHRPGDRPIRGQGSGEDISKVYVEDNYVTGSYSLTNEPYIERLNERPAWPDGLDAFPSDGVFEHNLAHVGACPAHRTPHDRRIIDKVRNGTGEYIDSQTAVGGYPDLPANSRALSVPEEGLRSWLADHAAAVERRLGL